MRDNLYHVLYLAEQLLGSPLDRATGEQAALSAFAYPAGDTAPIVLARHRNGAIGGRRRRGASRLEPGRRRGVGDHGCGVSEYWSEPDQIHLDSPRMERGS